MEARVIEQNFQGITMCFIVCISTFSELSVTKRSFFLLNWEHRQEN